MKITQQINVIIENLPNHEVINPVLEKDIKAAGDITGGRSAAKCYRTPVSYTHLTLPTSSRV